MTKATIYHNPRCSKSRQTLALLEDSSCELEIINYLDSPPDSTSLKQILERLGMQASELIRSKEKRVAEIGLDLSSASEEQLISAMTENPILIERPIVLINDKACLGRPPENVLALLQQT